MTSARLTSMGSLVVALMFSSLLSDAAEVSVIEQRAKQTRIYKTNDWRKVIEAIDETNKQLGFSSQFLTDQDARFCPARKVDVVKTGIPFLFSDKKYTYLQVAVSYKPITKLNSMVVRVSLQLEPYSSDLRKIQDNFFSIYHRKLSDNLFVEGLELDFEKLE
jgi:hypothetical protein